MSRILLVDDDRDMIRLSANWLKKAGHEVIEAYSGEEALTKASGCDLIILDYAMPGWTAPKPLRRLKAPKTQVVFR